MPSSAPQSPLLSQVGSQFSQGGDPLQASTSSAATNSTSPTLSVSDQLDTLERVLNELSPQVTAATPSTIPAAAPVATTPPSTPSLPDFVPAAVPLAVISATDTLNPVTGAATTAKESLQTAAPEKIQVDAGSGLQTVEVEPNPDELPVEVQGFLQEVKQNQEQLPQEIVITGDAAQLMPATPTLRPAIVLPITPEIEKVGKSKGPQWSVRWLVEWSRRLMKMFKSEAVYAEEPSK